MAALRGFILGPFPFARTSNFKNLQKVTFSVPFCAQNPHISNSNGSSKEKEEEKKNRSSWDAKNVEGKDYLYRLGQEADNMNITVGARKGLVDDLFVGHFLGQDADIVFDYRQKVTRSFEHLKGDYYIAPAFMEKIVLHIVKNYIAHLLDVKVPLILVIAQKIVHQRRLVIRRTKAKIKYFCRNPMIAGQLIKAQRLTLMMKIKKKKRNLTKEEYSAK